MSSTLAVLLNELEPELKLLIVERLPAPGLESSNAINNAGTGHAANCELNYTPRGKGGSINLQKAFEINAAFEQTLEFWSHLTECGGFDPKKFLNKIPHISFVSGGKNVEFLRQRYQSLSSNDAFSSMEWSEDYSELLEWMPLVINGRDRSEKIASTRIERGTDIDFGELCSSYIQRLKSTSTVDLKFSTELIDLERDLKGGWHLTLEDQSHKHAVYSSFVFLGAGGGALTLLQRSGISEAFEYGGFPVSGQWLVCDQKEITEQHFAKVYGNAKVGAPPMSVPHLDTRWIKGKRSLLFGPFAGFSTKFSKHGSFWDLYNSLNSRNLLSILQAGLKNIDLGKYLASQLLLDDSERIQTLRTFFPNALKKDWKLEIAGQRVQIIKRTKEGGVLKMGTEVVASSDGSLAALLGASPGASTAVNIMLEVLKKCWGNKECWEKWQSKLNVFFPSIEGHINNDMKLMRSIRDRNDRVLHLKV